VKGLGVCGLLRVDESVVGGDGGGGGGEKNYWIPLLLLAVGVA
jgi:hypothetical protein